MSEICDRDVDTTRKRHLRRELSEIRKAARALRDPGTTSSWRSPITFPSPSAVVSSSKPDDPEKTDQRRGNVDATDASQLQPPLPPRSYRGKGRKVFLYNWRSGTTKSSSDRSAVGISDNERSNEADDTLSFPGLFREKNSADERNGFDSKSDTHLGRYCSRSFTLGCKDARIFSPDMTPSRKRKSRKLVTSSASLLLDRNSRRQEASSVASDSNERESGRWMDLLESGIKGYSNSEAAVTPLLGRRAAIQEEEEDQSSSSSLKLGKEEDDRSSSSSSGPPALSNEESIHRCLDFPDRRGCGIPCYWRRKTRKTTIKSNRDYYSPSFSCALRQKKGYSDLSSSLASLKLEATGEEESVENSKSLSEKYMPVSFDELIGQHIVVQSLRKIVSKGRISPVYLFQGPRGTGKSSAARIFTAALNCSSSSSSSETRPCGSCSECLSSTPSLHIARHRKEISRVLHGFRRRRRQQQQKGYRVMVIDECHLLPLRLWSSLLKFSEEDARIVFILITTETERLPHAIISRCQKYTFNRIKDGEMTERLRKIATEENLEVDEDALSLIASNADGSLRDAETMLDQLTLLGQRITPPLVNELVGMISDEKLLELLELSMACDAARTVQRARELLDSGVDPLVMVSQMASLIMDLISDPESKMNSGRLRRALKLLSEVEKQLRISSDRSAWFTATLLQLGSAGRSPEELSLSNTETKTPQRRQGRRRSSSKTTTTTTEEEEDGSSEPASAAGLSRVWDRCVEGCRSEKLRGLLQDHGTLVSVSGAAVVVGFVDGTVRSRAERYASTITDSMEAVLRRTVDVTFVVLPRVESIVRERRLETAWLEHQPTANTTTTTTTTTLHEDAALKPPPSPPAGFLCWKNAKKKKRGIKVKGCFGICASS